VCLSKVKDTLRSLGVDFLCAKNPMSSVFNVSIRGGWTEQLRLLATVRPERLIQKFTSTLEAHRYDREFPSIGMVEVVEAHPIGHQQVVSMGTTAKTFFAEGFGAHNSVAEHSVRVATALPPRFQLQGLLHDASEAYIADVSKPLKVLPEFKAYREIEERLQTAAYEWAGCVRCKDSNAAVAQADLRMLVTEADRFFPELGRPAVWPGLRGVKPYSGIEGLGMLPDGAEAMFFECWNNLVNHRYQAR